MEKQKFNGTLESPTKIDLGIYTGNHNFTLNFLLRYEPSRYTADPMKRYEILNIDNIVKMYMRLFAGVPKLYFELFAGISTT
jgi:hypothetical protein